MMCSKKETASSYMDDLTAGVEFGEAGGIDTLELIELIEAQPLTEEFRAQAARLGVSEHALGLLLQLRGIGKFARGGGAAQFVIGNGRPEEIPQPAGQFKIAERFDRHGNRGHRLDQSYIGTARFQPVEEF